MGEFAWDYNGTGDILHIRRAGKKTAGSAELGEFTIDFDTNNNVIGLEIEHASEFLNQVGIASSELPRLKAAEIIVQRKNDCMIIFVKLGLQQKEQTIAIPTPVMYA